jgi:hypothetical protein
LRKIRFEDLVQQPADKDAGADRRNEQKTISHGRSNIKEQISCQTKRQHDQRDTESNERFPIEISHCQVNETQKNDHTGHCRKGNKADDRDLVERIIVRKLIRVKRFEDIPCEHSKCSGFLFHY